MTDPDGDDEVGDRRRRVLGGVALGALVGSGIAGAWYVSRPDDDDVEPTSTRTQSTPDPDPGTDDSGPSEDVPALVSRYAPDLYFGALEKWFPTDPRQYVVETPDGPVVDGFTALDAYSSALAERGEPPSPTVFYHVTEAAEGVDAIQYWLYSAFDQFTVNFHWHDWELLQVFVDRASGEPLLLSASAHSRDVPNNEFLDPDLADGRRPGILAEVGSHSSASEVNDVIPSFERLPADGWHSDVTNDLLDVAGGVTAPFAYGLPRDENARLPFVLPELDGHRLDDHPALSVDRDDFIDERATVGAWHGLPRPPEDLPLREPGLVLAHADSPTTGDATYALEPIEPLRDAIDDFVGPQLSFEFRIPGFVEDRVAGHITSVGTPWEQERFVDPLDDVTDPGHRRRIDGRESSGLSNRVVGRIRLLRAGTSGALGLVADESRAALEDAITVSLYELPVEVAVRLASEAPSATVTRNGVFGYLHVDPGEHLLVANGPGLAPVAERFDHGGGLVTAGAAGDLTTVASEDAGWIRGDGRDTGGISRVRVIEDFAGVVYDGRPVEPDRFAVAVHREGRYTVEIVDAGGRRGAYRVTPSTFADGVDAVREGIVAGKYALARTLSDRLVDLASLARMLATDADAGGAVRDSLDRAIEAADGAAVAAERGSADEADRHLREVIDALRSALDRLTGERSDGYDDGAVAGLEPRIRELIDRAHEAIEAELV